MKAALPLFSRHDLLDLPRQRDVEPGDAPGVMGGKQDGHPVVDIRPLGMMVHRFRNEGRRGHETEGIDEGRED